MAREATRRLRQFRTPPRKILSSYDFAAQRLFVKVELAEGARVTPDSGAQNYILNVLRLGEGDPLLLFNGRDGEWRARVSMVSRRAADLVVERRMREQTAAGDLEYAFAPLKQARLDYMVQKAAEMGAARLTPVITRRTQVRKINGDRLRANIIEAAEQCGLLNAPELADALGLESWLEKLPPQRLVIFCDEDAELSNPVEALRRVAAAAGEAVPVSVLIGPEGGFDDVERSLVLRRPHVLRISLGPRILRADTAAVAALALVQAVLGDWRQDLSKAGRMY
ncbi:16S rRNA (uracil(1498)-N(3))-methyltransferase [Methylocystis heyeri]|uniref:Ribosomal RNA small subunit methyltransferase E n=1 Tax=Methylocystis heyeri TaxID=391905 RepID=A0A6B8KK65_9HYPH|nr:16S rRNA (uracil(1498)-N(3))-methyltransferase [Methylocystis heyeri]